MNPGGRFPSFCRAAPKRGRTGYRAHCRHHGRQKTSDLIPLCHPLALTRVAIDFEPHSADASITCRATVETVGVTGVEMEALTAVQVALLTIYDMCKAVDRAMVITDTRVLEKQRREIRQLLRRAERAHQGWRTGRAGEARSLLPCVQRA